jgi:Delta7-sterol 5-desaturase
MEILSQILSKFPESYLKAVGSNAVLVGLAYLIFWKIFKERFKNWRIQQKVRFNDAQLKRELKNAIFTLAVGAFFACIVLYLSTKGYTKIYMDIKAYSSFWAFSGFFILLLVDDAWFYVFHRLMHHPRIYKYIHAEHHKSVDVNPFTSLSFHFLEPFILTFWIFPLSMIMPIYAPALGILQFWGLLENIKSHLGYEFYPTKFNKSWFRFLTTSTHHNMHHDKFNGNYGIHFRIWDRLLGTEFKDYEKEFDEIKERKMGKI